MLVRYRKFPWVKRTSGLCRILTNSFHGNPVSNALTTEPRWEFYALKADALSVINNNSEIRHLWCRIEIFYIFIKFQELACRTSPHHTNLSMLDKGTMYQKIPGSVIWTSPVVAIRLEKTTMETPSQRIVSMMQM